MREELLEYYERELTYLRQMGGEFARKYPQGCGQAAARSGSLRRSACEIVSLRVSRSCRQGASQDRRRFPGDQRSADQIIHPGYLRPIPSMTIVECQPDPAQGKKTAGDAIPKGSRW